MAPTLQFFDDTGIGGFALITPEPCVNSPFSVSNRQSRYPRDIPSVCSLSSGTGFPCSSRGAIRAEEAWL